MSRTKRTRATKPQAQPRQFVVAVPNPAYQGKVCGVRFFDGVALIAPHTIDPSLGLTVEETAFKMKDDFGYEVQPVEGV